MPVVHSRAAGEQDQTVGQPVLEAVEPQRRKASSRQLDRERHAVEATAQGRHTREVGVLDLAGCRPVRGWRKTPRHRSGRRHVAETDSPGTGKACSKGSSRRARLVASTVREGHAASSRSRSPPTPSSTCSQLSSTSKAWRDASQSVSTSSMSRPCSRPAPGSVPPRDRSATGLSPAPGRGTTIPSGIPSATSCTTRRASRVLPTPPGPTAVQAVLRQGRTQRSDLAAPDPRTTSGGSGSDRRRRTGHAAAGVSRNSSAACASSRRSATWSLRSNEETWLSTVRTEMKSRAAISAFVRCSETAARTSASRPTPPSQPRPVRPSPR